jgi:hypothetical protein
MFNRRGRHGNIVNKPNADEYKTLRFLSPKDVDKHVVWVSRNERFVRESTTIHSDHMLHTVAEELVNAFDFETCMENMLVEQLGLNRWTRHIIRYVVDKIKTTPLACYVSDAYKNFLLWYTCTGTVPYRYTKTEDVISGVAKHETRVSTAHELLLKQRYEDAIANGVMIDIHEQNRDDLRSDLTTLFKSNNHIAVFVRNCMELWLRETEGDDLELIGFKTGLVRMWSFLNTINHGFLMHVPRFTMEETVCLYDRKQHKLVYMVDGDLYNAQIHGWSGDGPHPYREDMYAGSVFWEQITLRYQAACKKNASDTLYLSKNNDRAITGITREQMGEFIDQGTSGLGRAMAANTLVRPDADAVGKVGKAINAEIKRLLTVSDVDGHVRRFMNSAPSDPVGALAVLKRRLADAPGGPHGDVLGPAETLVSALVASNIDAPLETNTRWLGENVALLHKTAASITVKDLDIILAMRSSFWRSVLTGKSDFSTRTNTIEYSGSETKHATAPSRVIENLFLRLLNSCGALVKSMSSGDRGSPISGQDMKIIENMLSREAISKLMCRQFHVKPTDVTSAHIERRLEAEVRDAESSTAEEKPGGLKSHRYTPY